MHISYHVYIYREYKPWRLFACVHFTLDASPEDLIRRRQARKKAAAKKRFSFSKMDEQLDCDESAVNCDVMDLSFFENNPEKDTGTSYDDIETRGTVPVGLFWGQSLGRSWNQIMWYCWHFSLVSGPPKKELWWSMSSKECLTVKPEATAVDCVLKCFKHPEWYGIVLLSSGILSTLSALESRVAWPVFSQFGVLTISTLAY